MLIFDWNVQRSIKLDLELYRFYWRAITLFYSRKKICSVFCIKFWFKFVCFYLSPTIAFYQLFNNTWMSVFIRSSLDSLYGTLCFSNDSIFPFIYMITMKLKKIALYFKNIFCYQTQRLFETILNFEKKKVKTKKYCWQNWKLFIKTKKMYNLNWFFGANTWICRRQLQLSCVLPDIWSSIQR